MKFIIHVDSNNYVVGLELSTKDSAVEIPEEVQMSTNLTCYKYENGSFSFDEDKKNKLEQQNLDLMEIEQLKKKLSDTDYIWNVINEGDHDKEYYSDIIENRHTWRLRIRELESEL